MVSRLKMLADNIAKSWVRRQPRPIICEQLKLIYYPVPKVATSTVRRYLIENGYPGSLKGEALTHNHIQHFSFPRITLKEALALQDQGYRSFGVVRNPYARVTSCYLDKIAGAGSRSGLNHGFQRYNRITGCRVFFHGMDFGQFVKRISRIPDWAADSHFRSQATFLPIVSGVLRMEPLMHMETFDQEFPKFCEQHGLPPWRAQQENKTIRKQTLLADSPESVSRLRKRYADCFARYGYDPNEVPSV